MGNEHTLLLVDDEDNILRSLSRTLRRDHYTIFTANSGEAGLNILADHSIGVIVSDQRMPGMNGSEFLKLSREHSPDSIRIMLSGYTELNSVTDAINHGNIFKFLSKPWDDDLLRENIKEAFRYYGLLKDNQRLSAEYKALNKNLELRVEERTRDLLLAMQRLKIEQNILEVLPCCVIGLDKAGMIVNANQYSHRIFDQSQTGLVGKDAFTVLPPDLIGYLNDTTDSVVNKEIKFADKKMLVSIKKITDSTDNAGLVVTGMLMD